MLPILTKLARTPFVFRNLSTVRMPIWAGFILFGLRLGEPSEPVAEHSCGHTGTLAER